MSIVDGLRNEMPRGGLSVVQDFVNAAAGLRSMVDLRELITAATEELGFDYYAIVHHVSFGNPSGDTVRLSNYPMEWLALIREAGHVVDPVLRAAERTSSGFKWDQLDSLINLTNPERERLRLASSFDIVQGFTVPNHVPGELFGSCNFAVRGGRDFPDGSITAAQALGSFAFEAARRVIQQSPGEIYLNPAPLSDRQRECLLFVARGKSDTVIAQILSIRPKTVNEHIEAAKRRYAVATRSQLLVRALFKSEICFSEVID